MFTRHSPLDSKILAQTRLSLQDNKVSIEAGTEMLALLGNLRVLFHY